MSNPIDTVIISMSAALVKPEYTDETKIEGYGEI